MKVWNLPFTSRLFRTSVIHKKVWPQQEHFSTVGPLKKVQFTEPPHIYKHFLNQFCKNRIWSQRLLFRSSIQWLQWNKEKTCFSFWKSLSLSFVLLCLFCSWKTSGKSSGQFKICSTLDNLATVFVYLGSIGDDISRKS